MNNRFDDLSRGLAGGLPRRRAVALIATTLVGSVLGLRPRKARAQGCGAPCKNVGECPPDCNACCFFHGPNMHLCTEPRQPCDAPKPKQNDQGVSSS